MPDYIAESNARQEKWITPADHAAIEAEVRRKAYSFDTEADIRGQIRNIVWAAANNMDRSGSGLCYWLMQGLKEVDADGMFRHPQLPNFPYNKDGMEALHEMRSLVLSAIVETEEQCIRDDEPVPDFSAVHAWLAVSPYTLYRFSAYVVEAAADAARCAVEELLDEEHPRSIGEATCDARASWVSAFVKDGTLK